MNKRDVWLSRSSGRAIVIDEQNRLHLFEVRTDLEVKGPLDPSPKFCLHDWIQPADCCMSKIDIGTYPYEPLKKYIRQKVGVQLLVDWFLRSLDGECSFAMRQRGAALFEMIRMKANREIVEAFQRIILVAEGPREFDPENSTFQTDSFGAQILSEMIAKWRPTIST